MAIILPSSCFDGLSEGPVVFGFGCDLGLPSMVCVAISLIAFIDIQRDIDALASC